MEEIFISYKDWKTGEPFPEYQIGDSGSLAKHNTICPFDNTPLVTYNMQPNGTETFCVNCGEIYTSVTQKEINKEVSDKVKVKKMELNRIEERKSDLLRMIELSKNPLKQDKNIISVKKV